MLVGVGVDVEVAVAVGVALGVAVAVWVAVGVLVAVGVSGASDSRPLQATSNPARTRIIDQRDSRLLTII